MKSPRRARGKVGRLPVNIRDTVNFMLVDGQPYSAIIRRLDALGYSGFTPHNISRWKLAGHQDWLDTQEKFDMEKLRIESSAEAVKDLKDPSHLEDASEILLALTVFRALQEMHDRSPDELLKDPTFLRLARISTRQLAERTRRERLQLQKECAENDWINQLAADPKKLASVLGEIRQRCSAQSTVAVDRA
jgi:hypothetical protein